jgi:hypothetical protein
MRRALSYIFLPFAFLIFPAGTMAQDILVPAGTLLRCTLDEPNLSSATASVGDPIICHLSSLQEFGHVVFPRGSYLGGHMESYKEPGHFVGKGNLKLSFDRIGLPTSDVPVPSKVIAASGYRVDRKGEIVGRGHAKRDTVEWLLPPLWPWKVITLPARGPRPALKGEEQITLRLMDDVVVPRMAAAADYRGAHPSFDQLPSSNRPASLQPSESLAVQYARINKISYVPPSVPLMADEQSVPKSNADQAPASYVGSANDTGKFRPTFIALKSGKIYSVARYRVDGGSLSYELATGAIGSIDLPAVDWRTTSQLNAGAFTSGAPDRQRKSD